MCDHVCSMHSQPTYIPKLKNISQLASTAGRAEHEIKKIFMANFGSSEKEFCVFICSASFCLVPTENGTPSWMERAGNSSVSFRCLLHNLLLFL